ncbi:MAG: hypothetical protein ACD_58C00131G0005 [uncultured bacterium]|nr:MAG: hypothetical protein ACD_58C00131G0005 [uncultured bacterium]
MKNKAFIFDWSGTLSNNMHLFFNVVNSIFKDLGGKPLSQKEIKLNFTLPYMKFYNKYFPNLTRKKQCILYEKYIHQSSDQLGEPKLYKNVKKIINYVKDRGYQVFIVSSDPASKFLIEIAKSGFSILITKAISDVHDKKDVITSLVKDHNLDTNNTFYVGDTTGDIEAEQFAKVKTIGITWGVQDHDVLAKSNPDYLVDDIIEIQKLITE